MNDLIYLDNNATTPCDPRVVEKMLPYFNQIYGNPANGFHLQGRMAAKAVNEARIQVANLIGANPSDIYFTSGATESNNLAIKGIAWQKEIKHRNRTVTSQIEHKAVLQPCKKLKENGFEVIFIPVDSEGTVNLYEINAAINDKTLIVSIQMANNEIGTIQPILEISQKAHQYGALVHTDAAQAVGKIPVDVEELGIDILSISAHKLYGPKGIGAIYIKGGTRNIPIEPIIQGGGQENGLRSGTSNVPAIVGFGKACQIAKEDIKEERNRITILRDHLEQVLIKGIPTLRINGKHQARLPSTSGLSNLNPWIQVS